MSDPRPVECIINGAHDLLERAECELESGRIDERQWFQQMQSIFTPRYLAADNPRGQSGYSDDDARWTHARSAIVDAIDRNGTFLDVGCASGYLMESVQRWSAAKGLQIEPYGLDIAPELAQLARRRLPHWARRIHVGNALNWIPPMRFDFVRTGLEYVPRRRQRELVEHLLKDVVTAGGRLIVGTYNEQRDVRAIESQVLSWGFAIRGRSEREHRDPRVCYRTLWIDT